MKIQSDAGSGIAMQVLRGGTFNVGRFAATLAIAALVFGLHHVVSAFAQEAKFATRASHAIIMDSRSGRVLYAKKGDEPFAPASMTKIMTMLLVFEKLKGGQLKTGDVFNISKNAWRRGGAPSGGSTMYAKVNSQVALSDLMQGIVVQSANDGAIAIAEGLSGTEAEFAREMTARARELGLKVSSFKNATGLPEDGHISTAYELASLARYLIEVFPEHYKLYSQKEFTWNNIKQRNRNPLLGKFAGADGVKTGFVKESGYGMIASAMRDGRRLIVVATGLKSKSQRAEEITKLLSYGFRKFRPIRLFETGETIGSARVWGGRVSTVPLVAKMDIVTQLAEEERPLAEARLIYNGPLIAPLKAGQKVGTLRVLIDGKTVTTAPVVVKRSIPQANSTLGRALDSALFMMLGG